MTRPRAKPWTEYLRFHLVSFFNFCANALQDSRLFSDVVDSRVWPPGMWAPHAGLDGAGIPESQATVPAEAIGRPAQSIYRKLASIAV